ncbi:1339_t:CDS:2 [Acaulospora morrowiae]|uniref:1339_t:CDS:1 n=1 Tax=Acaulospora morrowiae TaxID=94023 RepID=A0A9N8VRT0_9GLOM|nr:1339_t:CDS:2 [Acaulospora morrowiae]
MEIKRINYPLLEILLIIIFGQFATGAPILEIENSTKLSNTYENKVKLSTDYDSTMSESQIRSIELPSIELPSIELPSINITSFDLSSIKFEDVKIVLIVIGIIGILVILYCMPVIITTIIRAIGFGIVGIAKGSYAAAVMASYGGYVFIKSLCAVLQSAGALGIVKFKELFILLGRVSMIFLRTIFCCSQK